MTPRSYFLPLVLALSTTGCFLDGSVVGLDADGGPGGMDAGRMDAQPMFEDAGPELDAGRDSGPVDAEIGLDAAGEDGGVGVDAGPLVDGGSDAGPPDGGPPDAGPPDGGPPDAGPPDGGPPDAGPLDAGSRDAGSRDAGSPPPTCDALYGGVRQYELCSQTATRCVFHMNLIGFRSCNAACGGRCRAAYDDGDPNCSYGSSDIGCGAVRDNQICECVRSN